MFRRLILLAVLVPFVAAQEAKQHALPADDQLRVVRLRAKAFEAQSRMQDAQQTFDAAKRDWEEARASFSKLVEELKAKLPAPSQGKVWAVIDDQQYGIIFVEKPSTEGKP